MSQVDPKTQKWPSNLNCQKTLWNISLASKESLNIENGTLYTNHQINNAIKNQIYPKISHNIHLSGLIVRHDSLTVAKTHVTTIIWYEKQTDMQNS